MPVPIIAGAAAAVAARLAAKKAAQELAKKAVKKTVVKAASKNVKVKPAAKQVGAVKKVTRKAAPNTGLETRGAKPTRIERINRARDLQWDKAERSYDAGNEMMYTGLRSYPKGFEKSVARGAGKKNVRKRDAIRAEANKNLPVQINSANSSASRTSGNMFRGTDLLKANNARALKAANRTRSGKPTKKK
jgi:hypothetical protein